MNWWCTYDKIKTGRLSSRCTTTDNKPDMHGLQHIALEAKIKRQWLVSGAPLHGLISPIYTCQEAFHQQSAPSTPVLFLFCKPREYKVLHLILMVNQNKKYKHKYNDASQAQIALPGHLRFRSGRDRANVPVLPFGKQTDKHTNKQANTQTNRQTNKHRAHRQIHMSAMATLGNP